MVSTSSFVRSTVSLGGTDFPVLSRGRYGWIFVAGDPIRVPALLLRMPKWLEWLLKDYLQQYRESQSASTILAVTVVPQMSCNAACGYCIQNLRSGSEGVERISSDWMNESVIAGTVAFIEQQRVAQGLDGVALEIFGGEPLLNPERCYELLQRVSHMQEASITTNAIRLTPGIARRLTELGVSSMQVTFDGARNDHDSIRVLASSGGGTYDTIVRNLSLIDELSVLPARQLRVNVTASNLPSLSDLVTDLAHKLNPQNWLLYFALIDDNNIGWSDALRPGQSVDAALADLARQASECGFVSGAPTGGDCGFCSVPFGDGGMVINADGKLYSCWDSAGFSHMAVGDVWNGYLPAGNNLDKWVQCGYRSNNQLPQTQRSGKTPELDWTLRELAVASSLR